MYGVGVIGCGNMGTQHAGNFASLPEVRVVACADVVSKAAKTLAAAHHAKAYNDGTKLLADPRVDMVVITTPTPFHARYIAAAAKRGKHIFCEKPIARTLADARRAIEAAKAARVTLMVGHVLRFFPEYALAKRLVDEGRVGRPAVARAMRASGHPHVPSEWYADHKLSGGALMDMAIHDIDWLLWCFGPAQRVYCKSLAFAGLEFLDHGLVTIRFRNRVIAHVEGSWALTPGVFNTSFEIAGDNGLIEYDSQRASPIQSWIKTTGGRTPGLVVPESPLAESPYLVEAREFMDCVRKGRKPSVTPEAAYKALEIAVAALESARTGKPVKLPMKV